MKTTTLDFNVTGSERQRLVRAISRVSGAEAKYLGVPSCAYQVGGCTVDKAGRVSINDGADSEIIKSLIEALAAEGFTAQGYEPAAENEESAAEAPDPDAFTISLPLDGFEPDSLDRLVKLVASKTSLIQKALGATHLTIRLDGDKVSFPWWDRIPTPEETAAYAEFIAALCRMAKEAKRVTATEKDVDSEKYAFRGFLLRLGFIGADSKIQRKILLKNLSGSAAFPSREKAEAFNSAQKAKREEASA